MERLIFGVYLLFFIGLVSAIEITDGSNVVGVNIVVPEPDTVDLFYGEIWGIDVGVVAIASLGVYYNVTNTTEGLNNGFSFNTTGQGGLRVDVAGVYRAVSQWSFAGSANTEYHLGLGIGGIRQAKCHAERVIGTGGDVGSSSYTCLVDLNVGEIVTSMIENVESITDPTIHSIQLNLVRIGG